MICTVLICLVIALSIVKDYIDHRRRTRHVDIIDLTEWRRSHRDRH